MCSDSIAFRKFGKIEAELQMQSLKTRFIDTQNGHRVQNWHILEHYFEWLNELNVIIYWLLAISYRYMSRQVRELMTILQLKREMNHKNHKDLQ